MSTPLQSPNVVRTSIAVLTLTMALGSGAVAGQTGSVTGTVTDPSTGALLPQAQVDLPSLQLGTLTNDQGRFLILNVPAGTHEIRALLLGRRPVTQTVEVPTGETVQVNFQLETTTIGLEELVVTGVAAATPQAQLAFTVEQLQADELQRVSVATAGSMIQGRMPGAKVVQGSGQPGSEPSIQLRGPTSITGTQEPLVIIDGVISQGKLADIDPMDIESIEVVKGAAAASLYGSRAQAGVVQITTKRGTTLPENETQVTVRNIFNANSMEHLLGTSFSHPYRLTPDGGAFLNWEGEPITLPALEGEFPLNDGGDGTDIYNAFQDQPYPSPHDPFEQVFNPGNSYSSYVSVAGNEGSTQYRASGRYTREEGAIRFHEGLKQRNFRLNVDHRVSSDIQLALSTYYADSRSDVTDEGGVSLFRNLGFISPAADLYNVDENGEIDVLGDRIGWGDNPLYYLANEDNLRRTRRVMGAVDLSYSPLSWLSFQANASYDRRDVNEERYQPPGLKRARPDRPPLTGSLSQREDQTEDINFSATASLTKNFGDLTTRTRMRWLRETRDANGFSASGSDLLVGSTPRLSLVTSGINLDSYKESTRSEGYFLITALTYKERYILDLLGRRDGSSLFGPEERWQNYYRAAFAWRAAQEAWWPLEWINEFKPRFSLGTAGGRPAFDAQYQTYGVSQASISPRILGNDRLRPEHATEREWGLDAVIANRLRVQANYVDTDVTDQILLVPLRSIQGFQAQWRNAGTLESKTYELMLEAALLERPNMLWTARLSMDRTRQRITRLDVPAYRVENYRAGLWVREDEELGTFYGLKWADNCAVDLPSDTDCSQFQMNDDGLLVWVGNNNWQDGIAQGLWGTSGDVNGVSYDWGMPIRSVLDNHLTNMGNTQPDLNVSLFQDFQWGNFGVSALVDSEWGGQIYNQTRAFACRDWRCPEADQAGKPDSHKKPIAYYGVPGFYARNENNTWFMEDSDYIKLREVSVRYTVEERLMPSMLSAVGVEHMTINLTGRNVKTWTDYTGHDPEVGSAAFLGSAVVGRIDEYSYPNFRSFGIDVELVF